MTPSRLMLGTSPRRFSAAACSRGGGPVYRELSVAEQRHQAVLAGIEDGLGVTEAAAKGGCADRRSGAPARAGHPPAGSRRWPPRARAGGCVTHQLSRQASEPGVRGRVPSHGKEAGRRDFRGVEPADVAVGPGCDARRCEPGLPDRTGGGHFHHRPVPRRGRRRVVAGRGRHVNTDGLAAFTDLRTVLIFGPKLTRYGSSLASARAHLLRQFRRG